MRRLSIYSILAILALTGCQTKELNISPKRESKPFTATIEDGFNGAETKTYLDEHGNVLWKRGDQISIFVGSTINEQYQVTDNSEGKTAASLNRVTTPGFVAGGEIDNNVAFYPYTSTATIARNESAYVISDITLPAVQNYAEASFGNGAFPMAAVTSNTEDMRLKFKNVLGGLKLQLKGTARIKSIKVTGNQDEILCGAAAVTVSTSSTPSINLTDATAKVVTLDCGEGVQLDAETATPFVIALPPMTMEGGFTVVVTDSEGKQMEIKTTKTQTIKRSSLLKMPAVDYVGTSRTVPLTFTSSGETSISLTKVGSPNEISLEYSKDGSIWKSYIVGEAIPLSNGEQLMLRAGVEKNKTFSSGTSDYYNFVINGSGAVSASGNVMALLARDGSIPLSSYCFCYLFQNCYALTSAPEFPATTLARCCYFSTFEECQSLASAPELPAITLAEGCYEKMFSGCQSLITAPVLPATTLAKCCYGRMFAQCTSLTSAPILPATSLAESCYEYMFHRCTNLSSAPNLPATSLAKYCYSMMFYGCTSLTTAPELPATTLADYCYNYMFGECSNLTTAPELPATTLAPCCYIGMFYRCYALTSVPEILPATTLAGSCYLGMFFYCSKLTTAPILPAKYLVNGCYQEMFYRCSNLSYVKALFRTTPGDGYTKNWLYMVNSSGTFVKAGDASWTVSGSSGIPSGWTILTE